MIGEAFTIKRGEEIDLLLDDVGVLEATYDLVRDILSHTHKICGCFFSIFFLKKKKEMPEHLGKLVEKLDSPEDPTLSLKWFSVEIGAKVTMALAMAHGEEEVNWNKVISSMAKDEAAKDVVMKHFLDEAKKYSSKMMALIIPDDIPLASATPSATASPEAATTHAKVE
jgi:hypothetical protein